MKILKRGAKALILLSLLALLSIGVAAGYSWYWSHAPLQGTPLQQGESAYPLQFVIPAGASAKASARLMKESGLMISPLQFALLARWQNKASQIKAGNYELLAETTPLQLLDKLTSGDVTHQQIAIIEGWTFAQMRLALNATPELQHTTASMSDAELIAALALPVDHPEGQFFPDTYRFDKGSTDLSIFKRAHQVLQKKLDTAWQGRAEALPFASPYEALIMASIVEKETGNARDRSKVAAVFVNRLKKGMLLQTDPTVIYGMGTQFDGNLRKNDLQTDTPYNSYTRSGLPPTPIALPGQAAIEATLHPAPIDALYFVAKGDGTSIFSNTLPEHNQAVNRYQKK
ncbi:endolytic transglycosylase MltG [Ampullimonas aquatilis]|uniref:endolytic transglycosylase MltG n=1 Tax=Ampullimonas aquatilis TaxID=1341549 RepID=UPI003C772DDE